MKRVENRYMLFFFVHLPELISLIEHWSNTKLAKLLEEVGPVILFGPLLTKSIARVSPKSLFILGVISVLMVGGPLVGTATFFFGLLGSALSLLSISAYNILYTYYIGGKPLPGIGPVIPGVHIGPYYIPFLEGWLSILLIFLIHEGAHGIVAIRNRVPIEDAGIILFTLFPVAAYVSPNEEIFKGVDPPKRISVFSAGPVSNVLAYIPAALLIILISSPLQGIFTHFYEQYAAGVEVLSVPKEVEINGVLMPSLVYGKIKPGDVITSISGAPVYTIADVIKALREANTDKIRIEVRRGETLLTFEVPNRGYLGIKGGKTVWKQNPPITYHLLHFLITFLGVFALLNLMVGVVNALPFLFLDGGQAIEELEKVGRLRSTPLRVAATLLLIINALPWIT